MTDGHGQDSSSSFIDDFNLLMKARSRSAQHGLAQKLPGAFNHVMPDRVQVRKLFTVLVIWQKSVAIPQVEEIACHRSSPRALSSRKASPLTIDISVQDRTLMVLKIRWGTS